MANAGGHPTDSKMHLAAQILKMKRRRIAFLHDV
jgi:hypothetical protein